MRALPAVLASWACLACTAPMSDSLPESEPDAPELYGYQLQPDAPEPPPEPPEFDVDHPALLAASPGRDVWAVSDRRRLWVADAHDELTVIRRPEGAPEIVALDVDDEGELWVLERGGEAGGRLLSTPGAGEPLRQRGVVPVADASALEVTPKGIAVLGVVAQQMPWGSREFGSEAREELVDELGFWPDPLRVLAISSQGRDWLIRPTPFDGNMFDDLAVDAEGEILLFDGNELGCGGGSQNRWLTRIDSEAWTELGWSLDAVFNRHVAEGGFSYAVVSWPDYQDERKLVAVDRTGESRGLFEVEGERYLAAHDHGQTRLVDAEALWAVEGVEAERIGEGAPQLIAGPIDAETVDARGRLLVLREGEVHVGSAAGWAATPVW